MNPQRIIPPSGDLVTLAQLKLHCDIDPNDFSQDEMLLDMQAECISMLEGYRGVTRRPILAQTWREEFAAWGVLRLALPDVTTVSVTYIDGDGATQTFSDFTLTTCNGVSYVNADGPDASKIFVQYECALPEDLIPSAKAAVKLYVRHHYDARGVMEPKAADYFARAFDAMTHHIRAVRV